MFKRKRSMAVITAILVLFSFPIVVFAAGAGTVDDPFITYSYLTQTFKTQLKEELIKELSAEIKQQILKEIAESGTENTSAAGEYEAVRLVRGQSLAAETSCEIILRSGKATAFVSSIDNINAGIGLSDCTDGKEIINGADIPARHLLLIPRPDGRGINVISDEAYIMVRGKYTIVG